MPSCHTRIWQSEPVRSPTPPVAAEHSTTCVVILADDFTAELVDGRTVSVDDIRSGSIDPAEVGFGITDRRIEDALVDRIALLSVVLPNDTRVWSIEHVDATGRIAGVVHVASHQPAVAQREYLVRARRLAGDGPLADPLAVHDRRPGSRP